MAANPSQCCQERLIAAKLPRKDLEDKFLRMHDENMILKQHGRKQEEKIKRMATKLHRLVSDRKKQVAAVASGRTARDVELEEMIENQQDIIRRLQKENNSLTQKLQVANQQLKSQGKRQGPYRHVQSRLFAESKDCGFDGARSEHNTSGHKLSQSTQKRYGHSLLEEARIENGRLHEQILTLQQTIVVLQQENDTQQNDIRSLKHEQEVTALKLREQLTTSQKVTLNENIELIKLQRAMKEKQLALKTLEGKFEETKSNYDQIRHTYDRLLEEMERVKSQLLEEERRNLLLQTEVKQSSMRGGGSGITEQLEQQCKELQCEVKILRDANHQLTNSAFDREKETEWQELERHLRVQIAQLESAIKVDAAERQQMLEKVGSEQGFVSRLHTESRKAHEERERLGRENAQLRERLRLYTNFEDIVDIEELREALAHVRQKQYEATQKKRPNFIEHAEETKFGTGELQAQHAETIQELNKTREMLLMQHKINKDYQIELESSVSKLEEAKREYELKLNKMARLLDARAARIKKLEQQLHDVAYGTKQFKFQPQQDQLEDDVNETMSGVELERGENLFEIHISKLMLSEAAILAINERSPSLFVTFAFYDFELVSTAIVSSGSSPHFEFTAQFTVKVDDLFLHHLQKESTIFEVHQTMGVAHQTIAVCRVRFNQLLDKPQGRVHGSSQLTGMDGSNYGSMDFWARLRIPMDQAIRLYRERTKALGYLSVNSNMTSEQQEPTHDNVDDGDQKSLGDLNQLLVHIISCSHVESRRQGFQPNVYCVYKFFDFADHDTAIIPSSNNPYFDDRQAFPIHMDSNVDAYLKSEKLVIYVFDDSDPQLSAFLGKAQIDLIPLAHNKHIKAPFQLISSTGDDNGSIEISIRWQLEYVFPGSNTMLKVEIDEQEELLEEKPSASSDSVDSRKRISVSGGSICAPVRDETNQPTVSMPAPTPVKRKVLFVDQKDVQETAFKPVVKVSMEKADNTSQEDLPSESLELGKLVETDANAEVTQDVKTSDSAPTFTAVDNENDLTTHQIESALDVEQVVRASPPAAESLTAQQPVQLVEQKSDAVSDFATDESTDIEEDIQEEISDAEITTDTQDKRVTPSPEAELRTGEMLSQKVMVVEAEKRFSPPTDNLSRKIAEAHNKRMSPLINDNDQKNETDHGDDHYEDDPDHESETHHDHHYQDDSGHEDDHDHNFNVTKLKEAAGDTAQTADLKGEDDIIRISINHLSLDANSSVWGEQHVEQMFVEFELMGSVEETPSSVRKPADKTQKMRFNYEKLTRLDKNDERRELLANMLKSESNNSTIRMTVVSDPVDDSEDAECEEIGSAAVDLADILRSKRDVINTDIPVEDLRKPSEVMGMLNVSVEAYQLLQAVLQQDEPLTLDQLET